MEFRLHYTEAGNGFPLILLHGNGEDGSYFKHQLAYFSEKFRVIAVDTRGHGQSPRGTAPFTIRQFAEDLKGFMDELGLEKAHILGFSDGGNIALLFAARYPERVERLILNGANLNARGVKRSVQLSIMVEYRWALFAARHNPEAWKRVELLGLMVNDPNISLKTLKRVKAPTLVIAGTKDMIREDHTELIGREIPGAKTVLIPGDHFIAGKCPEAFNRHVERFLADHR